MGASRRGGVPNRRFLELTLPSRLNELRRHGTAFLVAYADIDHFKPEPPVRVGFALAWGWISPAVEVLERGVIAAGLGDRARAWGWRVSVGHAAVGL